MRNMKAKTVANVMDAIVATAAGVKENARCPTEASQACTVQRRSQKRVTGTATAERDRHGVDRINVASATSSPARTIVHRLSGRCRPSLSNFCRAFLLLKTSSHK